MSDWPDQRLQDGGPVYMETNPSHFIVEPWNCFSSLLILIPALYWFWKTRKERPRHGFLLFAIVMVIVGGLGSAIFHGFRVSVFFLLMDIVPSALLTLSLSIYLWLKILQRWWYIFFIMVPAFGVRFLFWGKLPDHVAINLSYFITGFIVALPLLILLTRVNFRGWIIPTAAVGSFIIALLFRQLDPVKISFLPMGTHFLWHTFSAVGAYFILSYVYDLGRTKILDGNSPAVY